MAIDTNLVQKERNTLMKLKQEADTRRNLRNSIEQEIKKNEVTYNDIKNERKKLEEKIFQVRQNTEKLRKKEAELKKLMEKNYNIDTEKQKFQKKVDDYVTNLFKLQSAKIICLEKYKDAILQKSLSQKKTYAFDEGNAEIETQIENAKEEERRLTETLEKISGSYDETKQKCKTKQNEAKKLTDNMTPNNPSFPYMKKFQQMPNDIEELQQKMDELQGKHFD